MNIIGKITELLPLQTGMSKKGQWRKQDIIIETEGQYPKKVCVSIWGDKINEPHLEIGNILDISFELESREFNGKWYTDVKVWKISLSDKIANQKPVDFHISIEENSEDENDILPF
jgi:hypothetical protein